MCKLIYHQIKQVSKGYLNSNQTKCLISKKMNKNMNQYDVRQAQIQDIVEQRRAIAQQRQQWDYRQLTNEVMMAPRFKYQNVEMSHHVEFIDDVKNIIYDEKTNVEDSMLLKKWELAPFQEIILKLPAQVPTQARILKKGIKTEEFDRNFGVFEKQGNMHAKCNQIHFSPYHYNLRSNTIFFYPQSNIQDCEKHLFYIELNERTYDYYNFNFEYFLLRGNTKTAKIKRQPQSEQLITILEKKLLTFSFRGAFALRNEVPPWQLEDYIEGEIDMIGPINFQKENHIKEIVGTKYYKETMGAFFTLLNKFSQKRSNISGQIMIPRWLKGEFKQLPNFKVNLVTNIVPTSFSLQTLKIKVEPNQIQALISSLKGVFPFYKNYLKRTFVVYDSQLTDENMKQLLTQLSYPMYMLGFPNNSLSVESLQSCIQSASNLYQEVIDYSYNTKLTSIGQSKLFAIINTNPSIKKLLLKGCYVLEGESEDFFEGLTNNLCLSQLEIDFLDHYGNPCVKYLRNYAAYIY